MHITSRVLVVGAGVIDTPSAFAAVRQDPSTTVLDRNPPGGGPTSAYKRNLPISNKELVPQPELMKHSLKTGTSSSPGTRPIAPETSTDGSPPECTALA